MEDRRVPRSPSTMTSANAGIRFADRRVPFDARERLLWLRSRHPRTLVWYGNATGRWWAFTGGRLVEALDAAELDCAITTPLVWPWPRVAGR